jgi:predicted pyridoxine 5'-phosphate oxidase superfamily flavin-nucleotide-binding protein
MGHEVEFRVRIAQRKKMNVDSLRMRELPIVTISDVSHILNLDWDLA